ncbi:MAG: amidohydrolase [Verrucomicrobia bacterium]|nr:amidohydrolase [Verrucomicrobiota bacterium]
MLGDGSRPLHARRPQLRTARQPSPRLVAAVPRRQYANLFAGDGMMLSVALATLLIASTATAADTLLVDGKIITLDARERIVEALAIQDGRIVATGTSAEILKRAGPRTEIIRLGGKTVLPGFIESHVHSIGAARASVTDTYAELSSIAEIQDWIRRRAKIAPVGQWIEVPRNEITRLKERRHPTPAELDAATTEHPVLYTSVRKHALNTAGFCALGITDATSKLPDGEIVRDESGRPVLIRGGDQSLRKVFPRPTVTREQTMEALAKLLRRYNEVGITTIYERATDRAGVGMFQELREQGKLTTRMRATFRFSARTPAAVEKYIKSLGFQPGEGDDWIRAVTMKITLDGGIHWGTTRLSEPYGERRIRFYRLTDPQYRGEMSYTPDELQTVFATVNKLGWPMSVHVTGDGGTTTVLDAIAAVAATDPSIKQRRFNLIHTYFPTPAIARRAKELGVGVDTQGYLYYRDAEAMADVYGQSWAERLIGLGEWARAGVPVGVNSDHMIGFDPDHAMNSFNPALMLWIAVARQSDRGNVYGAPQKLSRLDALRAVTLWAAWLSFDEDKLGSLEPGKLADLVVIDRDYLACPEADIRKIKVLRTVVGGKTVFQRP